MLPTNNSYYSSTFYSHRPSLTIHRYVKMAGGQEERPPSPKRDGGHPQRGRPVAGHRPSPSPVAPELAPHPRDPVPVPAADSAAFLFLPPTLSLVHPALHLPAWILILQLTPASNSVSLLTAAHPFPPNGDNHVTCRQSTAGRGPPSLRRRHPRHPEQGGGRRRTQRPVAPRIVPPLGQVRSYTQAYLVLAIVGGGSAGGGGGTRGCRGWRPRQKSQPRR
jgi:hypothetical protein